jgi:RNA polymerase subunit RPABC4/transcription elongation factor Spt4
MIDPEPTHPTLEWRGETYYLVKDLYKGTCHGCAFEHEDSDDCPAPHKRRLCYAAAGIFIVATPEALADYVLAKLEPEEDT